jgi:hypothetical protein
VTETWVLPPVTSAMLAFAPSMRSTTRPSGSAEAEETFTVTLNAFLEDTCLGARSSTVTDLLCDELAPGQPRTANAGPTTGTAISAAPARTPMTMRIRRRGGVGGAGRRA